MRELVRWIEGVEQLACDLYRTAAERFHHDGVLASFLNQLARDEAWHVQLMQEALQLLDDTDSPPAPALSLDIGLRQQVETPLREGIEALRNGNLTIAELCGLIATAEFSEWNDVFLYVIDALRSRNRDFDYIAAAIQVHEERIGKFLAAVPGAADTAQRIDALSHVWPPRLLVVEDDPAVRRLFRTVLQRSGEVHQAANGGEALEQLRQHHFSAILADIDMPQMSGTELFQRALALDSRLAEHFIFYTADPPAEALDLAHSYQLPLLHKPVPLQQMLDAVANVVRHTGTPPPEAAQRH